MCWEADPEQDFGKQTGTVKSSVYIAVQSCIALRACVSLFKMCGITLAKSVGDISRLHLWIILDPTERLFRTAKTPPHLTVELSCGSVFQVNGRRGASIL